MVARSPFGRLLRAAGIVTNCPSSFRCTGGRMPSNLRRSMISRTSSPSEEVPSLVRRDLEANPSNLT